MNNKEAIEILKELPDRIVSMIMPLDIQFDYKEALALAIKALEQLRWIPFNYEAIEQGLLEDHCFYLVIHKEFGTPMKAKFHAESYPYFETYSHRGTCYSFIDDGTVSQFMKLPDKPKEEEKS